jgi:metal-responsive CopG/Arc/MetJ family transcriptional regulator
MMPPIQRVNVDFTAIMLNELDAAAKELNISRQAVIKTLLRQGLDRHYLAKSRADPHQHPLIPDGRGSR